MILVHLAERKKSFFKKPKAVKEATAGVNIFTNMTVLAFFSCALTAYSPALALFIVTIAKDPVKIIILILR